MIYYSPDRGGLGDGIVGCASAFILSICLDKEFKILNGLVKFDNYFNIPDKNKITHIRKFNKFNYEPSKKHDVFFKEDNLNSFKRKNILITAGSNFSRFLYQNNNFKNKITIEEENIINYLFNNILIPKDNYLENLKYYNHKYDISNSIVLQIRTLSFKNLKDVNNPLNMESLNNFVSCFKFLGGEKKCILVTDNLELVLPILKEKGITDIKTIEGNITHSLKMNNNDYEKTLLDMLIIGISKASIISYWSNFGRLGILRTKKSNFWLTEPIFNNMIENGKNLKYCWRDKNDPIVKCYRKGNFKEILSKDKSFI